MNITELFAGTFGFIVFIILSLFSLILAIAWMIFPFLVIGRLDKLIALQEKATAAAARSTPMSISGKAPGMYRPPTTSSDPDIAAHLARKAERGEA